MTLYAREDLHNYTGECYNTKDGKYDITHYQFGVQRGTSRVPTDRDYWSVRERGDISSPDMFRGATMNDCLAFISQQSNESFVKWANANYCHQSDGAWCARARHRRDRNRLREEPQRTVPVLPLREVVQKIFLVTAGPRRNLPIFTRLKSQYGHDNQSAAD